MRDNSEIVPDIGHLVDGATLDDKILSGPLCSSCDARFETALPSTNPTTNEET